MAGESDPHGSSASDAPLRFVLDDGGEAELEFIVPAAPADSEAAAAGDVFIAAEIAPADLLADFDVSQGVEADLTVLLGGPLIQSDLDAILDFNAAPESGESGSEALSLDTLQPLPSGLTIIIDDDSGSSGSFGIV